MSANFLTRGNRMKSVLNRLCFSVCFSNLLTFLVKLCDPARVHLFISHLQDLISWFLFVLALAMCTYHTHQSTPVTISAVAICGYPCSGLLFPSLPLGPRVPHGIIGLDYISSPNILDGLVLGISSQDVPFVVWSFSAHVVLQWCLLSWSCNSMTTSLILHMFLFSCAYAISYVILNLQSCL